MVFTGCNRIGFENTSSSNGSISGLGQVRFIQLEEGFYGIIGENGQKYEPINLPGQYRQKFLEVKFTAKPRPDIKNTHMWGEPIEITDIKPVK
jgi:hypothetical protein